MKQTCIRHQPHPLTQLTSQLDRVTMICGPNELSTVTDALGKVTSKQ